MLPSVSRTTAIVRPGLDCRMDAVELGQLRKKPAIGSVNLYMVVLCGEKASLIKNSQRRVDAENVQALEQWAARRIEVYNGRSSSHNKALER
ncbi:hypothetical protein FQR65_LT17571 [Abscondita terminalis]|nr:hypothetical protein FQR65_LT17571 [Abscondita terminalis]